MRKLILLTLILFVSTFVSAQDLPEIVHLKNGNLIRGRITKIVPNDFLIIKSGDGKLYTYLMSEVVSIEENPSFKESSTQVVSNNVSSDSENFSTYTKPVKVTSESDFDYFYIDEYALDKGFRAFFDLGYSLNTREFVNAKSSQLNRIEMSFSVGNQFNDLFYLGVGAGYNYFYDASMGSYPVYIHPRFNFNSNRKTGYLIDFKVGYAFGQESLRGLYTFSGFGLRFAQRSGGGISLIVGFTNYYVDGIITKDGYNWEKSKVNLGALTFKVGFDF